MNDTPLLIAVAPNGARKLKTDHPHIPLNAEELSKATKNCSVAGASMIHLHVRDENNRHSLSVDAYKEAIKEIQKAEPNIFIQVTSEAVGIYSAEQQFEMIHELKPNAVSIGLREIRDLGEDVITDHFHKMREANTFPQLILYNDHDLNMYYDWVKRKVIPGKAYPILLVIGKETLEGSFDNKVLTAEITDKLPASSWMICAFGPNEYPAGQLATKLGGHIRLGFENNCELANGSIAKNNAELISQMVNYLASENIAVANYQQAIEIMRPDW